MPKFGMLCALASYFGVSADYLLGRTDVRTPEYIDTIKHLGLSEESVRTLEHCYSEDKENSMTLTINTLLGNYYVLHCIARYLYYNLEDYNSDNGQYSHSVLYSAAYKYYSNRVKKSDWVGIGSRSEVDAESLVDLFDNDMYKRTMMLEIQSELEKLLAAEDKVQHFKY